MDSEAPGVGLFGDSNPRKRKLFEFEYQRKEKKVNDDTRNTTPGVQTLLGTVAKLRMQPSEFEKNPLASYTSPEEVLKEAEESEHNLMWLEGTDALVPDMARKSLEHATLKNNVSKWIKQHYKSALKVLEFYPEYIRFFPDETKSDEEIIKSILKSNITHQKTPEPIRRTITLNERLMRQAIVLQYISPDLKADSEFMKEAIEINPAAVNFCDYALFNSTDFFEDALNMSLHYTIKKMHQTIVFQYDRHDSTRFYRVDDSDIKTYSALEYARIFFRTNGFNVERLQFEKIIDEFKIEAGEANDLFNKTDRHLTSLRRRLKEHFERVSGYLEQLDEEIVPELKKLAGYEDIESHINTYKELIRFPEIIELYENTGFDFMGVMFKDDFLMELPVEQNVQIHRDKCNLLCTVNYWLHIVRQQIKRKFPSFAHELDSLEQSKLKFADIYKELGKWNNQNYVRVNNTLVLSTEALSVKKRLDAFHEMCKKTRTMEQYRALADMKDRLMADRNVETFIQNNLGPNQPSDIVSKEFKSVLEHANNAVKHRVVYLFQWPACFEGHDPRYR